MADHGETDRRMIAVDPDRRRLPLPARRKMPWARFGLGSAAMIAILAHLALATSPSADRNAGGAEFAPGPSASLAVSALVPLAVPTPLWTTIALERPAFAIDAPSWNGLSQTSETRIDRDGAREDLLIRGAFAEPAPYLHLAVMSGNGAAPPSLFLDLARRVADTGLAATRVGAGSSLATKFGEIDIAETVLSDSKGERRACLVMRRTLSAAEARLFGWVCGAADEPLDRQAALCAIDGLALADAEAGPALAPVFAEAEPKRAEACRPPAIQAQLDLKPATKPAKRAGRRAERANRNGG